MLPFATLKNDLTRLKQGGVNQLVKELIISNAGTIKKMNTQDQLFNEGVTSLGVDVKPVYTSLTKQIKRAVGQPYDRVTLRNTGSFHKKFYLELDSTKFKLDSVDSKRDELVEKYTDKIFGLTVENQRILSNILKPQLIHKIKQRI